MNGELYPGEFEAIERQGRLDAVIPEQKMMTSEEAIAILTREIDDDPFMRTEYRERIHEALKMGIKALEQTRWIPVSEKPPKEDEKVLTTNKWKDGSIYVDTDRCVDGKWMLNIPEDGDTTIAWMPLPEPYKTESEEQT